MSVLALIPLLGAETPAWKEFAAGKNNLPDFSYAGYHASAIPLPEFTSENSRIFPVTEFGACPDDGKSDYDAIARAISAAAEFTRNDPRKYALVKFPAGRFHIREKEDLGKGPLTIPADRIILSGAGMYSGGTELFASAAQESWLIRIAPPIGKMYNWRGNYLAPVVPVEKGEKADYRKFSSFRHLQVPAKFQKRIEGLKTGEIVRVVGDWGKHEKEYWSPLSPAGKKRFYILESHAVQNVNGSELTLQTPVFAKRQDINSLFITPTLSECGIENMTLTGNFREIQRHYWSIQDDGFMMIRADYLHNGFFRNLRFRYGSTAIDLGGSSNCTVWNVLFEQYWGHLMVRASGGSTNNLFAMIREYAEGWHGIGSTDFSPGTVLWRVAQIGNIESHGNGNYNLLADCNSGDLRRSRWGGASPFIHRGLVYWNWEQIPITDRVFRNEIDLDCAVFPSVVGFYGKTEELSFRNAETRFAILEGIGKKVIPESLFEAQLEKRLGTIPEWLRMAGRKFESDLRFASGRLKSPKFLEKVPSGQKAVFEFFPDSRFSPEKIAKVEFFASPAESVEKTQQELLGTVKKPPYRFSVLLPENTRFVHARMTTVGGDEFHTPDTAVIAGNFGGKRATPADGFYLQDYNGAVPFEKLPRRNKKEFAEAAAGLVNSLGLRKALERVLDGDPKTGLYQYRRHIVHFSFPEKTALSGVEVTMTGRNNSPFMELEVAVSDDPAAWGDVHNRFDTWTTRMRCRIPQAEWKRFQDGKVCRFQLPLPGDGGKYYRVLVGGPSTIYEIKLYQPEVLK